MVGSEQALAMEQEVKKAIEWVPPPSRESGFYSWYFIVPKKDGGLRPTLDLCLLIHFVGKFKFKMLTLKQITPLYKLAHQILLWVQGKLLSLRAVYIPGYLNQAADILSRQGHRPRE